MIRTKTNFPAVAERVRSQNAFAGSQFLDEKSFTTMFCLERKRTERSGRRFVLMLLDVSSLIRHENDDRALNDRTQNDRALHNVVETMLHSLRETDIKGWYKDASVVGVIFTELGAAEDKAVATALLNRVTQALCRTLGIDEINEIRLSFHVFPEDVAKCGKDESSNSPLYPDQEPEGESRPIAQAVKRALDIVGSLLALVVLSPLLLAIAVAIKLTSPGPVVFRQQRIGRHGIPFTFLKFRSMYIANDETIHRDYVKELISGKTGAEEPGGKPDTVFKLRNDPRVTRIGRLLRKTSLDEVPQFVNVLCGEMSLVGPRPPIPYEFACYQIWHRRRLRVKPGITGLWQVRGRSRLKFDDMVRLDLLYAENWSVWLDLTILCKTPAAVLSGEGAY